jgi:putative transposase
VRIVRKSDGYYVQLGVATCRKEYDESTGKAIGIDVGLESFYTDSEGTKVENPRYLRKGEKQLGRAQRRVSRKFRKGQKQTSNYKKAKKKLGKKHLKVSRQRKDHAIKAARCVAKSNDFIAYEDLKVKNMVKNKRLSKSINDAGWYQFRVWLEYYGKVYGKITVAVPPEYTSQECSNCGEIVKKALSTRTHLCRCGLVMDRDENAALNILAKALRLMRTGGHSGTWEEEAVSALLAQNACGEIVRPHSGASFAHARRIPRL